MDKTPIFNAFILFLCREGVLQEYMDAYNGPKDFEDFGYHCLPYYYLGGAFTWGDSSKGWYFWDIINLRWKNELVDLRLEA